MQEKIPYHLAIIMDGNGRWAKKRGLPRSQGHKKGIENVERISRGAKSRGIKVLSLFAFSTENWKRPQKEIDFLFSQLKNYLINNREKLLKEGIRLNVMGRVKELPSDLALEIEKSMELTRKNKEFILNIVLNYGGRQEILDACKLILKEKLEDISEEDFFKYLYSPFIPDVDLLIRTSGEERVSNFLLWRIAYAEFYFTEVLWPDFSLQDLDEALRIYALRERRFGGLGREN